MEINFTSKQKKLQEVGERFDTMFVHVMSANLIFVLIPFSKMSHLALFPATQLVSELGWHLQPGAGQQVALALGKENDPL